MVDDDVLQELEKQLEELHASVRRAGFKDRALGFQAALKRTRLSPTARDRLWAGYQEAWAARRAAMDERSRISSALTATYRDRLWALDFQHSGGPILQGYGDWSDVGDRTRAAGAALDQIVSEFKGDRRLVKSDKDALFALADDRRYAINAAADTARGVHWQEASRIISETQGVIETVTPKQARAILKVAQSSVASLFLSGHDRDVARRAFQDLWDRVSVLSDEAAAEWRSRQEDGLARLQDARERLVDRLERVRANLAGNYEKRANAWSADFEQRVQVWIDEGEESVRELEESLAGLDAKIADAEERLR